VDVSENAAQHYITPSGKHIKRLASLPNPHHSNHLIHFIPQSSGGLTLPIYIISLLPPAINPCFCRPCQAPAPHPTTRLDPNPSIPPSPASQ
ncbi:hypothetical protein BD779DRAFT_1790392, partial [Infundibulicybe gibba]